MQLDIAEPDVQLRVDTDDRRFLQIALNLVGNALKFSPRVGAVRIEVASASDTVRFEVHDQGPGIPDSARGRLFSAVAAIDPDSPVRGTGLALCEQLVHRLEGRIGFEPRDGGGSRFWFELPRAVAEPLVPAP